jgi:hypothetical protein
MKKKVKITVETERVLQIRQPQNCLSAWCAACAAQVDLVGPEEAAARSRVSTRTIYRWVEAGQLHFSENAEGRLLICAASLKGG